MSDITLSKAFQTKVSNAVALIEQGAQIELDRIDASIAVWAALGKMGVDNIGFLKAPKKNETNNMWIAAYNTIYDAIAIDLYGAKTLAALRDKLVAREQPLIVSGGRKKGIEKTKVYLQQQVGKKLGLIRKDIAAYIDAGDQKPKTETIAKTDMDRVLDRCADILKQMNKAKPDDSITAETRALFKAFKPESLYLAVLSEIESLQNEAAKVEKSS